MAQKILSERSHLDDEKRTIAMTNKGMALLSGNIFCAHCGCRLATNHNLQRKLEQDLQKNKKQLETLRIEIAKVLTGDSIFTQEDLTLGLQKLKNDIAEAEEKLSQLRDEDAQKKAVAGNVIPAYQQFKTWAEEFEDASFEAKKMIANQLFKRVEVSKGYKLNIELNLSYQQFLEGWSSTQWTATGGIDAIA